MEWLQTDKVKTFGDEQISERRLSSLSVYAGPRLEDLARVQVHGGLYFLHFLILSCLQHSIVSLSLSPA
jgi:hypothetical protein